MRHHEGTPHGISEPVLAVVATSRSTRRFCRPTVLVTDEHSGNKDGHVAVICRNNCGTDSRRTVPVVRGVSTAGALNEGDVIRIGLDGRITVLYEARSGDNVIFLTGRCNAHCLMCPQPPSADGAYRLGEVTDFIRLLSKDTEAIGITGGEPTLARPVLIEAIEACRRYLPRAELTILTNGILLADFDYVKEIVSIHHPNVVFGIPLYSDTACEHDQVMGVEGFYSTLKGVHHLALFRQKVEIRTVILQKNVARLPQIAEFIYRNLPFAYHVAFMGLEMMHEAERHAEDVWIDPASYGQELETAVRVLHRAALNVSVYNHPLCVLARSLRQFARVSISEWKRTYFDFCDECSTRALCGGVFSTSGDWQSRYLSPIRVPF